MGRSQKRAESEDKISLYNEPKITIFSKARRTKWLPHVERMSDWREKSQSRWEWRNIVHRFQCRKANILIICILFFIIGLDIHRPQSVINKYLLLHTVFKIIPLHRNTIYYFFKICVFPKITKR